MNPLMKIIDDFISGIIGGIVSGIIRRINEYFDDSADEIHRCFSSEESSGELSAGNHRWELSVEFNDISDDSTDKIHR